MFLMYPVLVGGHSNHIHSFHSQSEPPWPGAWRMSKWIGPVGPNRVKRKAKKGREGTADAAKPGASSPDSQTVRSYNDSNNIRGPPNRTSWLSALTRKANTIDWLMEASWDPFSTPARTSGPTPASPPAKEKSELGCFCKVSVGKFKVRSRGRSAF